MKTLEPVPKSKCICINFRRFANKITAFYDKCLASAGISVNQYSLLVNLSQIEGCGTGELARRVRLEKSTLVRTLKPLLRDGFIIDKASETRGRSLHLSSRGKKVVQKALPLWKKAQARAAEKIGLSQTELDRLFSSLNDDTAKNLHENMKGDR